MTYALLFVLFPYIFAPRHIHQVWNDNVSRIYTLFFLRLLGLRHDELRLTQLIFFGQVFNQITPQKSILLQQGVEDKLV